MKPITISEARSMIKSSENKKTLYEYLGNFSKIAIDEAEKFAKDLHALKNIKLNDENVVKIVDFKPTSAEEVHKICNNVSLEEKEVAEILDIARKY
jgi:DNA-directed RNA polymerase subunit F